MKTQNTKITNKTQNTNIKNLTQVEKTFEITFCYSSPLEAKSPQHKLRQK